MVKSINDPYQANYGLPQPITDQFPTPVISTRDPTVQDVGYILGQIWVNKDLGARVWILQRAATGVATWYIIGNQGSIFTNITATNFITNPAATSTVLSGNNWTAIGLNPAIPLVLTPKGAAAGVLVTTGPLTVATNDIVATTGAVNAGTTMTAGTGITATTGDITATLGDFEATNGNLNLNTVGNGIQIKEGVKGRMGQATLVAGTQSIAIASVGANTRVFLSRADLNASPALGFLVADTTVAGTLTVNSLSAAAAPVAGDVSTFNYLCVEKI
jgi:hypothetical protein